MEFPPSPLDFVLEIGRADSVLPPDPINYSYIIYFCIENFLYIFECCMNPDETYNDEQFRQEEVDNCFDMAGIVVLSTKCYSVASELLFRNPYVENYHA